MFDFLCDNLLIICPNSYKEAILMYLEDTKKIINVKFMTIDEYKKALLFDYDVKTIHYLVKKGIKVDNVLNILNNLYYVENKNYGNEKLDYLVKIKDELNENHLLIYDKLFHKMLKRRKIIVYGYGKLDLFNEKLFANSTIIPYENYERKYDVEHFINIKDEVEFVFQKIIELLKNGVSINNISLMNISSEYIPYLKMMEKFYDIKINYQAMDTFMGTILGQKFYKLVENGISRDEIKNYLEDEQEEKEYSFIIDLLNKYSDLNLKDYQKEIKYELLNHKIKYKKLSNAIEIKNVFDFVGENEHIFLLGFNNSSIPVLKMDTDYITNDICRLVGLEEIENANELIKENTLNYLSSINNLTISYKDKSPFNMYYPSVLFDYMNYEIKNYERSMSYSDLANKSIYSMYLDDFVKYGIKSEYLDILYSNYGKNNYLEYDNGFTAINKDDLLKYLNDELTLSYSSIDNYYKCGFKYYLSNILKIDFFEETFYTTIGSLFHYVLSKMNENDFDLEKEYTFFLQNKVFNNKEKFFLEKLKKDLIFIIETIKKHQFISGFMNMLYEKKIDIKLMNHPYVHFKGFVDKIMYQEKNNETLVSIIDYKTGNPDINIKNLKFGLSMQLPIYLYLVDNSALLKNIKFTGFYLQHILNLNLKKNNKKTIEEENYNNLKLIGYSSDNLERLSVFDSTYENSEMIKGMKLNKDQTIAKVSRVLSDDEINKIIELTHEKIVDAMNEILKGNFSINPKIIDGKNMSCEYCHFNDICYHTEKNNVYLKDE